MKILQLNQKKKKKFLLRVEIVDQNKYTIDTFLKMKVYIDKTPLSTGFKKQSWMI